MADVIFPTGIPNGTVDGADRFMFSDTSDLNATKDDLISNLPISTATQIALNAKQDESEKGQANGYASLDATGKVPLSEMPGGIGTGNVIGPSSATDSNFASFDTTTGKLIKDSGKNSASFAPALGSDDNYVTDAEKVIIGNTSGTNSGNETATSIGTIINGATEKNTPVDADMVGLMDSAGSNILKKLSWSNIKATLKSYFDTLYQAILVSGTNIKTINGTTILGSGDLEIAAGSGGYNANIFLTDLTSSVVGTYKQNSYTPEVSETLVSGTANNNTVLIQSYIFDLPLSITSIDAGTWEFHPTYYVSSATGDTRLIFEAYSRTSGGTETLLFTKTSDEVNNTTRETFTIQSIQPAFSVNITDYLVIKTYVSTTAVTNKTLTYIVGDGEATHLITPLALRHSQLRARDAADSHPASAITNTPAGNIIATTVQGAIDELDTEKAPLSSPTFTGNATFDTVKITGGTPGVGKVLTSDADGDATWETASGGGTQEIRIRIPGEMVADTANYQGVFWRNTTGSTITISNVKIGVAIAAAGSGAAAAFNVYKSSGTASDGINTNAVKLFTSAVDLGTANTDDTNVPNTATVEDGRWVSLRCTSSAGATKKASDAEIVIAYS